MKRIAIMVLGLSLLKLFSAQEAFAQARAPVVLTACGPLERGWERGKTYVLNRNLWSVERSIPQNTGICYDLNGVSNVTINCQNHYISPKSENVAIAAGFTSTFIQISNSNNITIRNCRLTRFNTGIIVGSLPNLNDRSTHIVLEDNEISVRAHGIIVVGSQQQEVSLIRNFMPGWGGYDRFTSDNNTRGIDLRGSTSVTMTDNHVCRIGSPDLSVDNGVTLGGSGNVFDKVTGTLGVSLDWRQQQIRSGFWSSACQFSCPAQ